MKQVTIDKIRIPQVIQLIGFLIMFFYPYSEKVGAQQPIKYWRSSFETGFPGEWLNYDNGAWTEDGTPNPEKNEAWTIVDGSEVPGGAIHGSKVYKGWVLQAQSESHRAYPCIHCDYASPLVNSWWVFLDTDYANFPNGGWHHFATWGNNPDWDVHTMSVLGSGNMEMAHVSDFEIVGDIAMPLREWVRFTVYIEYAPAGNNLVYCWMNDQPCMKATNIKPGGSNLQRAHWGLYTSGNIFEGVQYNDDVQVWGLTEKWTDFKKVPPSPYDSTPIITGKRATQGKEALTVVLISTKEIYIEVMAHGQNECTTLNVYTTQGKLISQNTPAIRLKNLLQFKIDRKKLSSGVYFVSVRMDNAFHCKRITIY